MYSLVKGAWRFLKSPRAILYLAIALSAAALDMRENLLSAMTGKGECERIDVAVTTAYKTFTTFALKLGFRQPRSHYVRLVVLSPETIEPEHADIFAIVCKKREYLSQLIRYVGELTPTLIAIDLFPQSASCAGDEDKHLSDAIKDVSAHTPIVIANHTDTLEDLTRRPDFSRFKEAGVSDRALFLKPHLEKLEGTMLEFGLSRLSCDTRAVPISWSVYSDPDSFLRQHAAARAISSFAYQTATTYTGDQGGALCVTQSH